MGEDPLKSVTDANGRFHNVSNLLCCDQALFPTVGSANPVPTGLALARKVARHIVGRYRSVPQASGMPSGFQSLFDGRLEAWSFAGMGKLPTAFDGILEVGQRGADSALGILWFTGGTFANFQLRLQWKTFSPRANAGVFLRIPIPPVGAGTPIPISFYEGTPEVQIDERGKDFTAGRQPESVFGDSVAQDGRRVPAASCAPVGRLTCERGRNPRAQYWNQFDIRLKNHITVVLNGELVTDGTISQQQAEGFIGLQGHREVTQFRDILLRPL